MRTIAESEGELGSERVGLTHLRLKTVWNIGSGFRYTACLGNVMMCLMGDG